MPPRVNSTTDISALGELFAQAFSNESPLMAYVLRRPNATWPVSKIPPEFLRPLMTDGTIYKQSLGAELVEADNFAAAAIWFPPGVDLPARPDDDATVVEYREVTSKVKKEFLQGRKYWYLNIIARHPERKEPGVIRALFEPYIARARAEGIPLWLEAISEHSKQVYEHIGFRTVATRRLGVGKASPQGELQEGGEGVVLYAMIME